MQGFFGKQQYAANAPSVLTMKLSNDLCLECSTCAIFFNSSFTVSMIALLLNNNLPDMLMSTPLILFFSFVTSLYSVDKKALEQTFFPLQPAIQELHKSLVFKRFPAIYIARRYHEVQQFHFLVAYDVQLEAEGPAHGAFAPLGYTPEHLVDMDALVAAHP